LWGFCSMSRASSSGKSTSAIPRTYLSEIFIVNRVQ
jgi:hypothetical protein